jgi:hypothetical protein
MVADSSAATPISHYERERFCVEWLARSLGLTTFQLSDPLAESDGVETGVDVLLLSHGHRIGVQVTELDPGTMPGAARRDETIAARAAASAGSSVYSGWAANDPAAIVEAFGRTVERKIERAERHSLAGFDELWLLVCASIPASTGVVSTFIMTAWLHAHALEARTAARLGASRYTAAFLLPMMADQLVLYRWERGQQWRKVAALRS